MFKAVHATITIDTINNAKNSWEIVKPIHWIINIDYGYDRYLKTASEVNLEQRYLNAIYHYLNYSLGLHYAFLFDTTGLLWQDVIDGLRLFAMNDYADNFQKLIDFLGGDIPFDRLERIALIEKFYNDEWWNDIDHFKDNYQGKDNELDFIKANADRFIFDGIYYEP